MFQVLGAVPQEVSTSILHIFVSKIGEFLLYTTDVFMKNMY